MLSGCISMHLAEHTELQVHHRIRVDNCGSDGGQHRTGRLCWHVRDVRESNYMCQG
jgi:hypothetical protein